MTGFYRSRAGVTMTTLEVLEARSMPIPFSGCMVWLGGLKSFGYGCIWHEGRATTVHQAAWEILRGPVPDGLELDHICRVPACWNPEHLEPVTHAVNCLRSPIRISLRHAAKTHCPLGHEYAGTNLYVTKVGGRMCLRCTNDRTKARRKRVRAERRAIRLAILKDRRVT